jgi:hypothetical protein
MADGDDRLMVLNEILIKPVAMRLAPASLRRRVDNPAALLAALENPILKVMTVWHNPRSA